VAPRINLPRDRADPIAIDIEGVEKPGLIYLRSQTDLRERAFFNDKRDLQRLVITPKKDTAPRLVVAATGIGEIDRLGFRVSRACFGHEVSLSRIGSCRSDQPIKCTASKRSRQHRPSDPSSVNGIRGKIRSTIYCVCTSNRAVITVRLEPAAEARAAGYSLAVNCQDRVTVRKPSRVL